MNNFGRLLVLMLSGAALFAQESGNSGDQSDDILMLPEIVLDLSEPEYEDIDALLLSPESEFPASSILPVLGDVSGEEVVALESENNSAEDEEDSPLFADLLLYGGYAPLYGADFHARRAGTDSGLPGFVASAVHNHQLGRLGSTYTAGLQNSRRNELASVDLLLPGLIQSISLDFAQRESGLADLLGYNTALDNHLEADVSIVVPLSNNSKTEPIQNTGNSWTLTAGFLAGYANRSGRFSSTSGDLLFSQWLLSPELALELSREQFEARLDVEYRLFNNGSTEQVIAAGLAANFVSQSGLGLWGQYSPRLAVGEGFSHPFRLGLSYKPDKPWQFELSGGLFYEELTLAGLWEEAPLVTDIGSNLEAGDQYWETRSSVSFYLADALNLNGYAGLRNYLVKQVVLEYTQEGRSVAERDGLEILSGVDAEYQLLPNIAISGFWNGTLYAAASLRDYVSGHQLGTAIEFSPEKLTVNLSASGRIFTSLELPLLQLDVSYRISEKTGLELLVSDPLAGLGANDRTISNPNLSPMLDRGFVVRLGFRLTL